MVTYFSVTAVVIAITLTIKEFVPSWVGLLVTTTIIFFGNALVTYFVAVVRAVFAVMLIHLDFKKTNFTLPQKRHVRVEKAQKKVRVRKPEVTFNSLKYDKETKSLDYYNAHHEIDNNCNQNNKTSLNTADEEDILNQIIEIQQSYLAELDPQWANCSEPNSGSLHLDKSQNAIRFIDHDVRKNIAEQTAQEMDVKETKICTGNSRRKRKRKK